MIESIQQAFSTHDKYQVEVKLDYELRETKQTRYRVSTYVFIPQSLGINQGTYQKADFYGDIQNYIRLKTPPLILRDFTENSTSPLCKIEELVRVENWAVHSNCIDQVINNLKLLNAMLKSSIRDHLLLISHRISEAAPNSKIHLIIKNLIQEFLVETQKITQKYRALYPIFNLPNVDGPLFAAYQLIDESLSLLIEESATEIYQIVETYFPKKSGDSFKEQIKELIKIEYKYLATHGYPSIPNPDHDNETYAFRRSILKKYGASVLHLSTAIQRDGRTLEQVLFAVAAGVSMIFATVVAFYFQYQFGNFTFPFFIALVVGYMFKDRIKEEGRAIFARYLQNRLYDRRIDIKTQDGKHKLGVLKEKVTFVKDKDLPNPVIKARNGDTFTALDNDGWSEAIICYTKEIVLYTDTFKKVFADFPQITGLNDIIRFDIRAYLKKMGEPTYSRLYLQDDALQTIHCHKVHHLNFISRYRMLQPEKDKLHRRVRLVLNRNGIKRIEHVPI